MREDIGKRFLNRRIFIVFQRIYKVDAANLEVRMEKDVKKVVYNDSKLNVRDTTNWIRVSTTDRIEIG